jgi:hypothetical protein
VNPRRWIWRSEIISSRRRYEAFRPSAEISSGLLQERSLGDSVRRMGANRLIGALDQCMLRVREKND